MRILVVYWHPEPRSFNAAMFETICSTLGSLGHEVRVSNLHRMNFDPVSSRRNFVTVKEPNFFKPQAEEEFATDRNGFSDEIESEIKKGRMVRLDDLAVSSLVVRPAGGFERVGGPRICRGSCPRERPELRDRGVPRQARGPLADDRQLRGGVSTGRI